MKYQYCSYWLLILICYILSTTYIRTLFYVPYISSIYKFPFGSIYSGGHDLLTIHLDPPCERTGGSS